MWYSPNQRIRAIANAKRREREKRRRPLHIRRVTAEIRTIAQFAEEPVVAPARILLNDFTPKGMVLFSSLPLFPGQEVGITLEHPRRVYFRARVMACRDVETDGHIMSQQSYSFRLVVHFIFNSAQEQQNVRQFYDEVVREHIAGQEAA